MQRSHVVFSKFYAHICQSTLWENEWRDHVPKRVQSLKQILKRTWVYADVNANSFNDTKCNFAHSHHTRKSEHTTGKVRSSQAVIQCYESFVLGFFLHSLGICMRYHSYCFCSSTFSFHLFILVSFQNLALACFLVH